MKKVLSAYFILVLLCNSSLISCPCCVCCKDCCKECCDSCLKEKDKEEEESKKEEEDDDDKPKEEDSSKESSEISSEDLRLYDEMKKKTLDEDIKKLILGQNPKLRKIKEMRENEKKVEEQKIEESS